MEKKNGEQIKIPRFGKDFLEEKNYDQKHRLNHGDSLDALV